MSLCWTLLKLWNFVGEKCLPEVLEMLDYRRRHRVWVISQQNVIKVYICELINSTW